MSIKLLHVDSSINGEHSVSRALSGAIVARIRRETDDVQVTTRDLASDPIGHLATPADLALGSLVLEEFLAADVVVIGLGFYNFGIPSQLKAWIDRILIAGKTFRYTAAGPEGLAGAKPVILAIARGGFYGPDRPTHAFEHAESYLRTVFGFIGVVDLEIVAAEGIAIGPEQRTAAIKAALAQVDGLKLAA